jgi:hypothetical protein
LRPRVVDFLAVGLLSSPVPPLDRDTDPPGLVGLELGRLASDPPRAEGLRSPGCDKLEILPPVGLDGRLDGRLDGSLGALEGRLGSSTEILRTSPAPIGLDGRLDGRLEGREALEGRRGVPGVPVVPLLEASTPVLGLLGRLEGRLEGLPLSPVVALRTPASGLTVDGRREPLVDVEDVLPGVPGVPGD